MTFAKEADVKVDTILVADGGFTCLKEGDMRRVLADEKGELYIQCGDSGHHLDGQLDDGNEYIGLTIATPEQELEYLRAEVRFWRENGLAGLELATSRYRGASNEGDRVRKADILVNQLSPELFAFRDADRAEWAGRCIVCGKFLNSDEPVSRYYEDESTHVACTPEGIILAAEPLDHAKIIAAAKAVAGDR